MTRPPDRSHDLSLALFIALIVGVVGAFYCTFHFYNGKVTYRAVGILRDLDSRAARSYLVVREPPASLAGEAIAAVPPKFVDQWPAPSSATAGPARDRENLSLTPHSVYSRATAHSDYDTSDWNTLPVIHSFAGELETAALRITGGTSVPRDFAPDAFALPNAGITAVPEPSTLLMVAVGGALLVLRASLSYTFAKLRAATTALRRNGATR